MRSPIMSNKHYVHQDSTAIASGSGLNILVVTTLARGAAIAAASDVFEGAIVKAVYLEYWVDGGTASKTVIGMVVKIIGNGTMITFAESTNLGTFKGKKNILEVHQGLAPSSGNQMAIFRHWIKIPKGKQRFGLGDSLQIKVSAVGTAVNVCGFATFKDYS